MSVQSSQTTRVLALENHSNMQQKVLAEVIQSTKPGRTNNGASGTALGGSKKGNIATSAAADEDKMDIDDTVTEARKKKCVTLVASCV